MTRTNLTLATSLVLLVYLLLTSRSFADTTITFQPISFNKGVSYNDIFVTSKVIETLQKNKIPFYISNEGIIYVEEKNEKIINVNNPTKGLGLTQFPELSRATLFMALLSAKGIEFTPSKSGDNKYFNVYYKVEDQEKISNEIMRVFIETIASGVLINGNEN